MNFKLEILTLLVGGAFLSGCGMGAFADPNDKASTQVIRTAGDEVKWISTDLKQSESPLSLWASSYKISPTSRLLIRLSSLKGARWQILDQQPLLMKLETRSTEMADQARSSLRLCPLQKNWMMLATWSKAHPYRQGQWSQAGGDLDWQGCLEPLPANHALISHGDEANFCSPSPGSAAVLCFDLKPWFSTYVRERDTDFGLILINESAAPVFVQGDSTLGGPSLFWRKFR